MAVIAGAPSRPAESEHSRTAIFIFRNLWAIHCVDDVTRPPDDCDRLAGQSSAAGGMAAAAPHRMPCQRRRRRRKAGCISWRFEDTRST